MTRFSIFFAAAIMLALPAFAQSAAPSSNEQPIEITATKTVEWLRDKKQYVARENVIVIQGKMTLYADLLTADYREGASSSTEIYRLTAEGNVRITDVQNTAYGDKAVYEVPAGVAVLTGENLRLISPDQTVTARDRMEYHANERYAKAVGNAKVVRGEDTLTSDAVTAFFKDSASTGQASAPSQPQQKSAAGGDSIDRLEADGNVTIKTPTEKITGNKAVYKAATNVADITGKVKVTRDQNTLEGQRAEVNLTTSVSKMYGSNTEGGRVRGVFFPGKDTPLPAQSPKEAVSSPQTPVTVAP